MNPVNLARAPVRGKTALCQSAASLIPGARVQIRNEQNVKSTAGVEGVDVAVINLRSSINETWQTRTSVGLLMISLRKKSQELIGEVVGEGEEPGTTPRLSWTRIQKLSTGAGILNRELESLAETLSERELLEGDGEGVAEKGDLFVTETMSMFHIH